jgi:hypothetical protein
MKKQFAGSFVPQLRILRLQNPKFAFSFRLNATQ